MKQRVKHIFKHTVVYSLGNLSVKLVGFILLPFYTSHLTVSQYGILAILEVTMNLLAPLFFLNMNQAITRFYKEVDGQERGRLLFTALAFVAGTGILVNVLLQPFSRQFSLLIFDTPDFKVYFNLLFVNIALQNITNLVRGYFNARENSVRFSLVNFLRFLFVLFITVYFLVVLNWGIKGILLAQTISFALILLIFFPYYARDMSFGFDRRLLREMIRYSAPLAFSTISSFVLAFGDRYVLKFLMDESAVGIYSLASKLANVIDFMVLQAFQLTYLPYAFKTYKSQEFKRFHSRLTTYLMLLMVFLALALGFYSDLLMYVFAPTNANYRAAAQYVPWLAFLRAFYVLRFMFALGLHINKKTGSIPVIVLISAALNIGLNFVLIPEMGINGAILSSFVALIVMDILFYYKSYQYYKVSYEFSRIFWLSVTGVGIYLISTLIKTDSLILSAVYKTFLLLLYPFVLYVSGFLRYEELMALRGFIKKWKNISGLKQNIRTLIQSDEE